MNNLLVLFVVIVVALLTGCHALPACGGWMANSNLRNIQVSTLPHPRRLELQDCEMWGNTRIVIIADPDQPDDDPLVISFVGTKMVGGSVSIQPKKAASSSLPNEIVRNIVVEVHNATFVDVKNVFSVVSDENFPADDVANVSLSADEVTVSGAASARAFSIFSRQQVSTTSISIRGSTLSSTGIVGIVSGFSIRDSAVRVEDDTTIAVESLSAAVAAAGFAFNSPTHDGNLMQQPFTITNCSATVVGRGIRITAFGRVFSAAVGVGMVNPSAKMGMEVSGLQLLVSGDSITIETRSDSAAVVGGFAFYKTSAEPTKLSVSNSVFGVNGTNITAKAGAPSAGVAAVFGVSLASATHFVSVDATNLTLFATGKQLLLDTSAAFHAVSTLGVVVATSGTSHVTTTAKVRLHNSSAKVDGSDINVLAEGHTSVGVLGIAASCYNADVVQPYGVEVEVTRTEFSVAGENILLQAKGHYATTIIGASTYFKLQTSTATRLMESEVLMMISGQDIVVANLGLQTTTAVMGEAVFGGGGDIELTDVVRHVSGSNITLSTSVQVNSLAAILGISCLTGKLGANVTIIGAITTINGTQINAELTGEHALTIGGVSILGLEREASTFISIENSSTCVNLTYSAWIITTRRSVASILGVASWSEAAATTLVTSSQFRMPFIRDSTFHISSSINLGASLVILGISSGAWDGKPLAECHATTFAVLDGIDLQLLIPSGAGRMGVAILSVLAYSERGHPLKLVVEDTIIFASLKNSLIVAETHNVGNSYYGAAAMSVAGFKPVVTAFVDVVIRNTTLALTADTCTVTVLTNMNFALLLSFAAAEQLLLEDSDIVVEGKDLRLEASGLRHGVAVMGVFTFCDTCGSSANISNTRILLHATKNVTALARGYHAVSLMGVAVGDGAPSIMDIRNSKFAVFGGGASTLKVVSVSGMAALGASNYYPSGAGATIVVNTTFGAYNKNSANSSLTIGSEVGNWLAVLGVFSKHDITMSHCTIDAIGMGNQLTIIGTADKTAAAGILASPASMAPQTFLPDVTTITHCDVLWDLGPRSRPFLAWLEATPTGIPAGNLHVVNSSGSSCPLISLVADEVSSVIATVSKHALGCHAIGSPSSLHLEQPTPTLTRRPSSTPSATRSPTATTSSSSSLPVTPTTAADELPPTSTLLRTVSHTLLRKSITVAIGTTEAPPTPTATTPPQQQNTSTPEPTTAAPSPPSVKISTVLPVSSADADALEGSTAVSTALTGGLTTPTASANVARIGAALRTINCPLSEDDLKPSTIEHPIQFQIGTSRLSWFVGSTLGSTALLSAIFGVLLTVSHVSSLREAAPPAVMKLSAIFSAVSHAYFTPNICGTATTILVHSSETTERVVAIVCVAVVCTLLGYYLYFVNVIAPVELRVVSSSSGAAKGSSSASNGDSKSSSSSGKSSSSSTTTDSDDDSSSDEEDPKRMLDLHPEHGDSKFLIRFGIVIDATTKLSGTLARNYYAADVVIASLCTIAAGTRPDKNCIVVAATIVLLSIASLLYHAVIRPYDRKLDTVFAILIAANQVVLGVLTIAVIRSDESSAAMGIIGYFLLFQIAVFFIQTCVQAFWSIWRLNRRRHLRLLDSEDEIQMALLVPATAGNAGTAAANVQQDRRGATGTHHVSSNPLLQSADEESATDSEEEFQVSTTT